MPTMCSASIQMDSGAGAGSAAGPKDNNVRRSEVDMGGSRWVWFAVVHIAEFGKEMTEPRACFLSGIRADQGNALKRRGASLLRKRAASLGLLWQQLPLCRRFRQQRRQYFQPGDCQSQHPRT